MREGDDILSKKNIAFGKHIQRCLREVEYGVIAITNAVTYNVAWRSPYDKEERFERHPSSTFTPLKAAYDQRPSIVMNRCGSPAHLRLGEGSEDGSSGEGEGRLRGRFIYE